MHSTIYELSFEKLPQEMWHGQGSLCLGDNSEIDYYQELNYYKRGIEIDRFFRNNLLRRLFYKGNEKDAIVYNGKVDDVKREWYSIIKDELGGMMSRDNCDTYYLERAIANPLGIETKFLIPDSGDDAIVNGSGLLAFLNTLEEGEELHILSVFDYHF